MFYVSHLYLVRSHLLRGYPLTMELIKDNQKPHDRLAASRNG
ncbi:hypothetical protein NIES23_08280 [Trichormus variabilis NIES-23]|uniref:Uncharacterized protein n=1 Tax=Trichormus variabilis NIES-23 TaxID=1973479 RepID=A0A1Z4KGE8_ANAVA|nr:hypothetical protein NIES23_08280 [Trichormus variabilis NIES-23]